jgi:hypothetical protein
MSDQEPVLPEEVMTWVRANKGKVEQWMSDPAYRRQLLNNPAAEGLSGPALDWVNGRIQARGIERLVGEMPGHLVAM